jgi:hypothetical protein
VPVTIALPLLQVIGKPPFCDGSTIENNICPLMDPFFCSRKPPCSGLAKKVVPVVLKENCQFPPTWVLFGVELELLPPPQLEVVKAKTTSKKRHGPVAARADVLCFIRNFCSCVNFRVKFMGSQSLERQL